MSLEEYWGIGPKTSELLAEELGVEDAIRAIEAGSVGTLVGAGVARGRATRILRRAHGEAGLDTLATGDARSVYDELLSLAAEYAVTDGAADRIRVLTPLSDRAAAAERLDEVLAARDAWESLDEGERRRVLEAFEEYDAAGGTDRAAVEAVLALREAELEGEAFDVLAGLDGADLREAAGALGYLRETDGGLEVLSGADEELDRARERLAAAEELEGSALDVIESVREAGTRDLEEFRGAVIEYVAGESGIDRGTIRAAAVEDAVDSADFVSGTLRALVEELEADAETREREVAGSLRAAVEDAGSDVETAVEAVSDVAFSLSLGRFAAEYDLRRPELVEDGMAVRNARNPFLPGEVQPVTYAVGPHEIPESESPRPPVGDRVAVLTGANSGGKTTLLETLCAVAVLASMGLPVPAEAARVGSFDHVVFHRRHASFNAGVLESTLRSVVPPLVADGRTLMLVDEFEAITEPGRAADLLNGLVGLTVERDALGVFVTHLAADLEPLPAAARIDGIFAEGLTPELELRVDYQPRFGTVGRSTPEFIVSRLVANADDRLVRQGFEELAAAVGQEAVQRTLSDVRWTPD
ncbi:DNA mismatch repair protein [Halalkalicoccus tibetensis]|uniref:DNA mismatch repair protein n=1 Tax=Halalkalicoccus tibetensis TaxID=175632 RepID=A0ABD5V953_9EURY